MLKNEVLRFRVQETALSTKELNLEGIFTEEELQDKISKDVDFLNKLCDYHKEESKPYIDYYHKILNMGGWLYGG